MPLSIANYLNIRNAYFPTFSPDGQRVAFLTNITGVPQVWAIATTGGWPDQLTFGVDRVLGVWYAPHAPQLIFARDAGGNENAQLYLLNDDGTEETQLTHDLKAQHHFGGWAADGKSFTYSANERDKGKYDVYVQTLNGKAQMVWQNDTPGIVHAIGFSPAGTCVLAQIDHGGANADLYEIDLATRTARHLTPHQGAVHYSSPVYAQDGKTIYCVSNADHEYGAVVQIDLATLKVTPLAAPDHEIESVTLSHRGDQLAAAINLDGANRVVLFDLQTQATRVCTLPVGMLNPTAILSHKPIFSPDDQKIAFGFATSSRTADVWLWDVGQEATTPLTHSSYAGVSPASLIEPELIHYPTFDGRQIPAWWYLPAKYDGRLPVIVYVHGGPEAQHQPTFFAHFQYLLSRGYAILAPNVRGSSGYGKTYSHLDDIEKRMDSVTDVAHAVYWLRTQANVDAKRVAVFGRSYGGFMVLSAITTYPDLWAAAVDIVGISNFVTFLEKTSAYRRSHREKEYGSLEHDREVLTRISPIHQADQIRAPLFVAHGANDPRVPLNEAEQMVKAVQARGVPVEFAVYPDEGHAFSKLTTQLDVYPRIAEFLDKYLR